MMKGILSVAAVSLVLATNGLATAQFDTSYGMDTIAKDSWEQMVTLEPCMNGGVSASGLYPSQIAENMSFSTRGTLAKLPPG